MYSVTAEASELWRLLLSGVAARAGVPLALIEHAAPRPIDELWRRADMGAVFMCGLPYSRAEPRPILIAAPVPAPAEFAGRPEYFSEFVVRADGALHSLEDTFGLRLALTVPDSQSGCVAALTTLMSATRSPSAAPLYREVIAPTVTPFGALSAVLNQEADVAPIDAYALRLLQRNCGSSHEPPPLPSPSWWRRPRTSNPCETPSWPPTGIPSSSRYWPGCCSKGLPTPTPPPTGYYASGRSPPPPTGANIPSPP